MEDEQCTVCNGQKKITEDIEVIGMDGEYDYEFISVDCPKCVDSLVNLF